MVADPRFSSALQSMTGMPDPLAPRTAKAVEQPKLQQTPLDRAYQEREQTTRALGNATTQLAEFEGMQQAQKAKTAAETAKGEFDLAEQRAKAIEAPELRAERTQLRESIPKAFVPTQDNATDMATLFSLIGVIGFAVGAGGKGNAMAAMSAMNGMAQGYQQGRMDLYAKEKDKFETNVKAIKNRIDAINSELEDVMQTAAVNYDKGLAKLKMVATKNDADFISQYADKYGLPKAVEYLRSLDKSARDTVDRLEKEQLRADEKERDRLFRMDLAKFQRGTQVIVQGMRQEGKTEGKLTEKDRAAHRLRQNLIPDLEEGIDILDRLNQEGKWTKMTTLLAAPGGLGTNAAELAFRDDPEALKLIRTLAFFRSKEFETGGKALTKMEDRILAPLYRSDLRVYEAVRNAMVSGVQEMSREKAKLEDQFPSLGGGSSTGGRESGKTVVRSGKVTSGANAGKTVIEYSDGTREYK